MATRVPYWDYDPDAIVSCGACGWSGRGKDNQRFLVDLLDVRCGQCKRVLLMIPFPTMEETRAAAVEGNEAAAAELPRVERAEARLDRAEEFKLKDPGQLPELAASELRIDWDFEARDDEVWTVLRHDGAEIWRELAFYEGYARFAEVFAILCRRYGGRLSEVRPTPASEVYLYGDRLSAPETIRGLNAGLQRL